MARIRGRGIHEPMQLHELVDKSPHLAFNACGKVVTTEYVETPYNEYGLVEIGPLFTRLLGSVAVEHVWRGNNAGLHHIMWPNRAYRELMPASDREVAVEFRTAPTLMIDIPRQMHEYLHKVTEPPTMPGIDIMQQYALEQQQVRKLAAIVSLHGRSRLLRLTKEQAENSRRQRVNFWLDKMQDGYLGIMPDRE